MSRADELKRLFMLKPGVAFLNHGSFGATPRAVFEAYQGWQAELERQPVEFLGRRHNELMQAARASLGAYLGTAGENVVYVQNATIAMNMAARSLALGPGDEVLGTQHEYGAIDRMWAYLARERGFAYVRRELSLPLTSKAAVAEEFWAGVTERTRVISISHITSPTAIMLPVEEIVARARAKGIITIIDGAHTIGQVPLDLEALGADFYCGNLHKWLMAPKGAGFLYARPGVQAMVKPLVVSWGKDQKGADGRPFIDDNEWVGTRDVAAFLATPAAIAFQAEHGWEMVRGECHRLAAAAQRAISEVTGLGPLHSEAEGWFVQMCAARLPDDTDIVWLKERMYDDYAVEAPLMDWNGRKLIRVSVQGYVSEEDIERLVAALQALLGR